MWIARNKKNRLFAFADKPKWNNLLGWMSSSTDGARLELYDSDFVDVTFENSPVKITKLK